MTITIYGNAEDVKRARQCLEIFMGDYPPEKQYAASILLHMIVKEDYAKLMDAVRDATGFKVNDRNSSKVVVWKKKVKARGKCEVCGARENLVAHHIVPWSHSIKGRTDVNNGQCLCRDCHKMMHNDFLWMEYMQKKVSKNE